MAGTIAQTPFTRRTACSIGAFSAALATRPVRGATPFSTATPIRAALMLGSRSSTSMRHRRSNLSSIVPLPQLQAGSRGLQDRVSLSPQHALNNDLDQNPSSSAAVADALVQPVMARFWAAASKQSEALW